MDRIDLINKIVRKDGVIEYHLNLLDCINEELMIVECRGFLDDDSYVHFMMSNIDNYEAVIASIAESHGVCYEEDTLFTRSNGPRDFLNLLHTMLDCYAYFDFEQRGWIK